MVKSLKQYFEFLGYALVGIAFGYCCFYLILNIYHYQELRRDVYINFESDASIMEIDNTLSKIEEFINESRESTASSEISTVTNKLEVCVNSFRNETFTNIRSKNRIDIIDVYNFSESFSNDVLNDCIVYQMYDLTYDDNSSISISSENKKLLRLYINDILQDTSYLKKDLDSNSSYFYNTDISNSMIKSEVRDGFYEVLSAYKRALKLVEYISDYYQSNGGV